MDSLGAQPDAGLRQRLPPATEAVLRGTLSWQEAWDCRPEVPRSHGTEGLEAASVFSGQPDGWRRRWESRVRRAARPRRWLLDLNRQSLRNQPLPGRETRNRGP